MVNPLLSQLSKPNGDYVIATLLALAHQFGEQAVLEHYIPFLFNLLQRNSTRNNRERGEEVLVAVLRVFDGLIDILNPATTLQVFVLTSTALFVLLLNPPPSAPLLRCLGLIMVKIATKIGDENTKNHIFPYIKQFLSNYDDFYKLKDGQTNEVIELSPDNVNAPAPTSSNSSSNSDILKCIYSPEMAHILYDRFKLLLGRDYMKQELPSSALLEALSHQYYFSKKKSNVSKLLSSGIQAMLPKNVSSESKDRPTWVSSFPGSAENPRVWNFAGNVVNTFKGHTAGVRSLSVCECNTESIFVTGSKDQTVKVWSLEQPAPKVIYQEHTHAVSDVHFMHKPNVLVTCAHAVHVWDIEKKSKILNFDIEQGYIRVEPVMRDENVLVALDNESSLSVMSGRIKCIALSKDGNYIATGSSMGEMCLLDQRTGCLMAVWKAHEGPILKLKFWTNETIISSSNDRNICLWSTVALPPILVRKYRGHTDPIETFDVVQNTLISVGGTKIGVAPLNDEESVVTMNPIRLQNVKASVMKAMAILPHYQLALFGADDGFIRVCN